MPELLKVTQLVDQHRMTEVQVGRSGIKPSLDPQGAPSLELFNQLSLNEELIRPTLDEL
jgi:hypothetical protein